MTEQLSFQDAILHLDSIDAKVLKNYVEQRIRCMMLILMKMATMTAIIIKSQPIGMIHFIKTDTKTDKKTHE